MPSPSSTLELTATPISSLPALPNGTKVLSVAGRLVAIKRRKTGEGSYGPYSFQDATLQSEDGVVKYPVVFNNHPDYAGCEGRVVTLSCTQTAHGIMGVKITEREDYVTHLPVNVLWVTKTASVLFAPAVEDFAEGTIPEEEPVMPEPTNNSKTEKAAAVETARRELAKTANLYILCLMATEYVAQTHKDENGEEMSKEQKQACTSTLFISAEKKGLAHALPVAPVVDFIAER